MNSCRESGTKTVYRQRIAIFCGPPDYTVHVTTRINEQQRKEPTEKNARLEFTLEQGLVCERHYCDNYT